MALCLRPSQLNKRMLLHLDSKARTPFPHHGLLKASRAMPEVKLEVPEVQLVVTLSRRKSRLPSLLRNHQNHQQICPRLSARSTLVYKEYQTSTRRKMARKRRVLHAVLSCRPGVPTMHIHNQAHTHAEEQHQSSSFDSPCFCFLCGISRMSAFPFLFSFFISVSFLCLLAS